MKVILATEPIKYPLAGIGRYPLELAKRLAATREIEELKLFHSTSSIERIPLVEDKSDTRASNHGRLSAFLRRQTLLIGAYRLLHLRRQAWVLHDYKDYIYHGPSFYLPHKLERTVTTFYDMSIFTYPECYPKDRVRYMEKSLHENLDSAELILTVSDSSRGEIIRLFNYSAGRIITTKLACSSGYTPYNPAECLPTLQKCRLAWQAYALYIGTMEPRKNIRSLLHAYQLLPMEIRMRYPLVLSGYRGWEDDMLWQLVERGTREGWIRYLGYISDGDLPYLYAATKVLAYPSFCEGFGSSILEAISCDVPVVYSNVTSLPGVVGDTGLIADPNNIDAISAQILQSLQDDSWREIATARDLAQAKQFSWENCATQIINAYKLL